MSNANSPAPLMSESEFGFGWSRRRRGFKVIIALAAIFLLWFFKVYVIDDAMSKKELRSAIKLFDIDSQWQVKEKYRSGNDEEIVLVPEVSFRVRNEAQRRLRYVYFLGVYRFLASGKSIGEGYEMALKKGLPAGQESERIRLTCQFGYRSNSTKDFSSNPQQWENASVDVFANSKNSGLVFIKTFYISRRIAGLDLGLKIKVDKVKTGN